MKSNRYLLFFLLILLGLFFWFRTQRNRTYVDFQRDASHLIYTKHARCRMDCRHINENEVKEVLEKGSIDYAKSEPNGKPDPKYALEGITSDHHHLRIIFAPTARGMVVITCIDLDVEWACNCQ